MSFKALVKEISTTNNVEDFHVVCGHINHSFEHGKISWSDYEILYSLVEKIKY